MPQDEFDSGIGVVDGGIRELTSETGKRGLWCPSFAKEAKAGAASVKMVSVKIGQPAPLAKVSATFRTWNLWPAAQLSLKSREGRS